MYQVLCKTECMVTSRQKNAGQSYDLLIANKSLQNMAKFNSLGTTGTNKKSIHEEIKSTL